MITARVAADNAWLQLYRRTIDHNAELGRCCGGIWAPVKPHDHPIPRLYAGLAFRSSESDPAYKLHKLDQPSIMARPKFGEQCVCSERALASS